MVIRLRPDEVLAPPALGIGVTDLALVLLAPFVRDLGDIGNETCSEIVQHGHAPYRLTADLPRSVKASRAPVRCRKKVIGAVARANRSPSRPPRPSTPSSRKAPASERAGLLFSPHRRSRLQSLSSSKAKPISAIRGELGSGSIRLRYSKLARPRSPTGSRARK